MNRRRLNDWLTWQETLHPSTIDLGLDRVAGVWRAMGAPHPAPVVITVAGTNGKGSSIALLEAILRAAGYRTGSYTSPHLLRYNERVRIDGEAVADELFCDAFTDIDNARADTSLTYFEFGTLAALWIMSRQSLDVALLEVGMGGRLDATNIIDADLALITSIGLDHTQWLGDTEAAIAAEKAGILRPGRPAVLASAWLPGVIADRARDLGCRSWTRGRDFRPEPAVDCRSWSWHGPQRVLPELPLPALAGEHQLDNAAAVLMALECLREQLPVSDEAIRQGLTRVVLPGRMMTIPGPVPGLLDVAHNADGVAVLRRYLLDRPCAGMIRAVAGFMIDKDLPAMLGPLESLVGSWYLAPLPPPRGAGADTLHQLIVDTGVNGRVFPSVSAAWRQARADAVAGDHLLAFGSFVTVAQVLSCISPAPGLVAC